MTRAIERPLTWCIPGMGEPSSLQCADVRSWEDRCPTGQAGHLRRAFKINCGKPICPECWEPYINKKAHFALNRVQDARCAMYMAGHDLDLGELIFSPPPEDTITYAMFTEKTSLERIRKTLHKHAEAAGMVGYFSVIHPYRGRKDRMEAIRRRELTAEYAWHAHLFGLSAPRVIDGELNPEIISSTDFNATTADTTAEPTPTGENGGYKTGWTYKWVSEFTKNGYRRNLYKKVRYELDHSGLSCDGERYGPVLTWAALLSTRAIKRTVTKREEPIVCDVCGSQAHRFFEDEDRGLSYHRCEDHHHQLMDHAIERARTRYKLVQGVRRYQTLEGYISEA